MQFSLESISELERSVSISIPKEKVDGDILARLRKIAPQVKLPGFRPGKIPFSIIQKRYTDSVRAEVVENLIRDSFDEVLEKENLRLAGAAKFELLSSKPEEPLSYKVTFEILPQVQIGNLSDLTIEKPVAEVTEHDIDETIEKLRHEHVMWKEVTDKAKGAAKGDQLVIDFTLRVRTTERPPEPKIEKDIEMVLGNGKMWPDFEEHLYNSHAGDEVKFMLTFPDTHYDRELAGKNADFTVQVNKHSEPIYPPIDDELAKKVGIKNGGLTALRNELKGTLERDLNDALKALFKKAVMDTLCKVYRLTLPESIVKDEIAHMQQNYKARFGGGKNAENMPEIISDEKCRPIAERHITLGLLLSTLIREKNIKVESSELRKKIEEMASVYEDSATIINWYYSNRENLVSIESMLLEDKALEEIQKNAKVVEKPMSYRDAIKYSRGGE